MGAHPADPREGARLTDRSRIGHPGRPVPPVFLKAMESEHRSGAAPMTLLDAPMTGLAVIGSVG